MFRKDDNKSWMKLIENAESGFYDEAENEYLLECNCDRKEHMIGLSHGLEDGWHPSFVLQPYLNSEMPIHRRICIAIRYIFGLKQKWQPWACIELRNDDVQELKKICKEHLENVKSQQFGEVRDI